jgi:hypothetical protein
LPGCQSKCGELDIPYPFGISAGCYRPGFKVTCNRKPGVGVAQKLTLGDAAGPAVLEISVPNSTVRIRSVTWFFAAANTSMRRLADVPSAGAGEPHPYVLSPKRNSLVHVGCGFRASSWTAHGARAFSNCSSSCHKDDRRVPAQRCSGTGCCEARLPSGGLDGSFRTRLEWGTAERRVASPWIATDSASLFAAERVWWRDGTNSYTVKMSLLAFGKAGAVVVPAVLDWAFDKSSTCAEAAPRPDIGCASKHSECVDSDGGARGYVCKCGHGYQGNPYVRGGCQGHR